MLVDNPAAQVSAAAALALPIWLHLLLHQLAVDWYALNSAAVQQVSSSRNAALCMQWCFGEGYSLCARNTLSIGSCIVTVTVHSTVQHNGQQQLCVLE